MTTHTHFRHEQLHAFALTVLRAGGCSDIEAGQVADHLVDANLSGHDSHGIGLIPVYVDLIQSGLIVPNHQVEVVSDLGAVLVLDAGRGFGHAMATQAMDLGIAKARQLGAVIVALRTSGHCGRIGAWAEHCARAGFASIHFVNGIDDRPLQAIHGGSDPKLSTNPFCAALPGPDGPIVLLDMATATIAAGKVRVARNEGVRVPEGALLDHEGQPTTDPNTYFDDPKGALIAFGGHKGSGLAIMCEMLAGALTGGGTIRPETPEKSGIVNNMLSIIIDPEAVGGRDKVAHEASVLTDWLKASRQRLPGVEVLMPGEPERIARAERRANGIAVDARTLDELILAGSSLGIERATLLQILS